MDRLIYIAMTGANHVMLQQASVAHNLANATTTGYRAETNSFRALPVLTLEFSRKYTICSFSGTE